MMRAGMVMAVAVFMAVFCSILMGMLMDMSFFTIPAPAMHVTMSPVSRMLTSNTCIRLMIVLLPLNYQPHSRSWRQRPSLHWFPR